MSDAWKPVYEGIKAEFLPKLKAVIGQIDWSGNTFKDVAQCAKAMVRIIDLLDDYTDQLEALTQEDREHLAAQAFDDAVKAPFGLESFDDNAGAWLYRLFAN
jgi:hypothetical protein